MLLYLLGLAITDKLNSMNKYTLDALEVRQWLQDLYNLTIEFQMMEQKCQMDYIISLFTDFKNNLAQQIAFTINNQADNTLYKQTIEKNGSTYPRDSVKVKEYESNKIQSDTREILLGYEANAPFSRRSEGHLDIRIYYNLL